MQPNDILVQASSNAATEAEWHVIHRAVSPMGALAWIQALSVARRVAREQKVDIYRAEADRSPTLYESHRP